MKTIIRNKTTFFPMGDTFASCLFIRSVFTKRLSSKVFVVNAKDFTNNIVTAFNIENCEETVTIPFTTPVTQLKKF